MMPASTSGSRGDALRPGQRLVRVGVGGRGRAGPARPRGGSPGRSRAAQRPAGRRRCAPYGTANCCCNSSFDALVAWNPGLLRQMARLPSNGAGPFTGRRWSARPFRWWRRPRVTVWTGGRLILWDGSSRTCRCASGVSANRTRAVGGRPRGGRCGGPSGRSCCCRHLSAALNHGDLLVGGALRRARQAMWAWVGGCCVIAETLPLPWNRSPPCRWPRLFGGGAAHRLNPLTQPQPVTSAFWIASRATGPSGPGSGWAPSLSGDHVDLPPLPTSLIANLDFKVALPSSIPATGTPAKALACSTLRSARSCTPDGAGRRGMHVTGVDLSREGLDEHADIIFKRDPHARRMGDWQHGLRLPRWPRAARGRRAAQKKVFGGPSAHACQYASRRTGLPGCDRPVPSGWRERW